MILMYVSSYFVLDSPINLFLNSNQMLLLKCIFKFLTWIVWNILFIYLKCGIFLYQGSFFMNWALPVIPLKCIRIFALINCHPLPLPSDGSSSFYPTFGRQNGENPPRVWYNNGTVEINKITLFHLFFNCRTIAWLPWQPGLAAVKNHVCCYIWSYVCVILKKMSCDRLFLFPSWVPRVCIFHIRLHLIK